MSGTAYDLFGTDGPRAMPIPHTVGPVSLEWIEGGIHAICFGGIEVIRAVTFPVRDRDWGTLTPALSEITTTERPGRLDLAWTATYRAAAATLVVDMTLVVTPDSLTLRGRGQARGGFETNRAGITVLHPVAASGCPVRVEHTDGSAQDSLFPRLIDPWQPFQDIRALTHHQSGVATDCRFAGDVFEMEDQRQWSDASFKTYNRPLAKPWPYILDDGDFLDQQVTLRFSGSAAAAQESALMLRVGLPTGTTLPQLALALTPDLARLCLDAPAALDAVAPQRLAVLIDPIAGDMDLAPVATLAAQTGAVIDLEYAARFDGDLDAEFAGLAQAVQAAGLTIATLFVCPAVDRQSTPPGSDWPTCPPLADIYAAARRAFPAMPLGGGMLSYFPEFNRKRPPTALLDFTGHGTNPIVHAADDRSVMQSLTALPWIIRSGKAIVGDLPYRLGLSSIPMRQNPYGSRTMDNPQDQRICMASSDPRHHAQFGAAFTLGYLAAVAPFGLTHWTPAEAAGPRGIDRAGRLSPLGQLLTGLGRLAGQAVAKVEVSDPERIAGLATASDLWIANLTDQPQNIQVQDGGIATVTLPPYGTVWRNRDQS